MDPSSLRTGLPGQVRQAGYVVRDLDATVAGWVALGVGPWFVLRGVLQQADHRGRPCAVSTSIAFANLGELQLEVIQPEDDTPSIYTEFLDAGREGFHQLAWWAADFPAAVKDAEGLGWPVVWSGGEEGSTRYAYLEPPPGGPAAIVEISEVTADTAGLDRLLRTAAAGWDGSDPIRSLR